MAQCVTENGPAESSNFMKPLVEFQQQQNEHVTVALEKIAIQEVRSGKRMYLTSGDSTLQSSQEKKAIWILSSGLLIRRTY